MLLRNDPALPHGSLLWTPAKLAVIMMIITMMILLMLIHIAVDFLRDLLLGPELLLLWSSELWRRPELSCGKSHKEKTHRPQCHCLKRNSMTWDYKQTGWVDKH